MFTKIDCKSLKLLHLAILLIAVVSCLAQFGGGSGTEDDPWQIGRGYHLDEMRQYIGSNNNWMHFIQTHQIDLDYPPWNEGEGWLPIGDSEVHSFQGTFDGNGFHITGLYINRLFFDNLGLFGYTRGATFRNVHLRNVNVTGGDGVGALIGWNKNSSFITNCSVTGVVSGRTNVGGLLGYNGISSVLENSYSTCQVRGSSMRAGGLVGYHDYFSLIANSFSTGNVTGYGEVGGLIGRTAASAVVNSCFSTGEVNGTEMIGGLAGRNGINCRINNSYSTGNVSGHRSVGGLVGLITGGGTISNCYSTGRVTANFNMGGLVGLNEYSTTRISFWDTETSMLAVSAGGTGLTTEQMTYPHIAPAYQGWDFQNIWVSDTEHRLNNGYPFLVGLQRDFPDNAVAPQPGNRAVNISIETENVGWSYYPDTAHSLPVGFRVYMNESGEFNEADQFVWVLYEEDTIEYYCSEIIPELIYATTYYWKVIATTEMADSMRSNGKTTQHLPQRSRNIYRGDALHPQRWSFTTEKTPYPQQAVYPNPEHQAENVSLFLTLLAWDYYSSDIHTDPEGFKVYFNETGEFDEDEPYEWVDYDNSSKKFNCRTAFSAPLRETTDYYWMVVPTSGGGDAENCPVWSFTTGSHTNCESAEPFPTTGLERIYPNPFNPSTTVEYSLQEKTSVFIRIMNIRGQTVRTFTPGFQDSGNHRLHWDGRDDRGNEVSSGVYFCSMTAGSYQKTMKLILLR